jgi:endonuclease YncB( thermonuclease family)
MKFFFLILAFIFSSCGEKDLLLCTKVIDGDTLEAGGRRIRLIGISAPEQGEDYYQASADFLKGLVLNQKIRLEVCPVRPEDSYGRLRAVVYLREVNVNLKMLENGWATLLRVFPCHEDVSEWQKYEDKAREERKGVFQDEK